ncbi:LysR family transcriptional regulator [Lactobacillus sp. ESL0791]|uniref:LysR family transcriptional regulator n=1 Tax=Lactobacillus sp. ESL0791 TaxID=2983234 RepID=UPI0023F92AF3|nr:LysR family transcriptional regulator [Lactobacillus sp. ESL0791]MDF7638099.1 LysR family transcriptional regulator [Lactobacillus sp. ESL0791]
MNSTQINCFLSLAKTLNFTKSANNMYLSQSTVSKNIKNLEKELHVTLFERRYHKIYLTEKGKIFYNQMLLSVSEINDTIQSIQQNRNIERLKIKMGYTDLPFEKKWLPTALRLINTKTKLALVPAFVDPGHENNISKLISDGTIDLMIMQKDIISKKTETQYFEILQKGFSVVVLQGDALYIKRSINFDDLVGRNIYLWNGNDNFPAIESLKFSIRSSNKDINFEEVTDSSILIAYVRAKMGIGIVPSILYNKDDSDLRYIPLSTSQKLSYGILSSTKSDKRKAINVINKYIAQAINISKTQW